MRQRNPNEDLAYKIKAVPDNEALRIIATDPRLNSPNAVAGVLQSMQSDTQYMLGLELGNSKRPMEALQRKLDDMAQAVATQ
jgi:hypothetical protein